MHAKNENIFDPDEAEIKRLLGEEKYRDFIEIFGGRSIYIPRSRLYEWRNKDILKAYNHLLYNNVLSENAYKIIASRFHLSTRTIRRVVKKMTNLN